MSSPTEIGMLRSPEGAEYAVHSDNFLDYCHPANSDLPPQYFSPTLVLPFVEEDLKKIDQYARERNLFIDNSDNLELPFPPDEFISIQRTRSIGAAGTHSDAFIELGLTRYFDNLQKGSFTSDVIDDEHSKKNEMMPDVYRLIENGYCPQVHYHEHPDPSLFSDRDYLTLIQKGAYPQNPEIRPVRTIVLSLPNNFQLLATATSWTPLLDKEEVKNFTEYWDSRFDELDRRLAGTRGRISEDEWCEKANSASHDLHMELLTSMGVKSYISRNRRDFYEFS